MGTPAATTEAPGLRRQALGGLVWGILFCLAVLPAARHAVAFHAAHGALDRTLLFFGGELYRPLALFFFAAGVAHGVRVTRCAEGAPAVPLAWLGPLAAGVLYALYATFHVDLEASLWIMILPVGLAVDVLTLVLLGKGLVSAWATPCPLAVRIGSSGLVLAVLLFAARLYPIAEHAYFLRHRAGYEHVVAALEGEPPSGEQGVLAGVEYRVDAGPPLRLAFPWSGILDNWTGVVWDPSGTLEHVLDESAPVVPGLLPARFRFGSTLTRVRHIAGPWYVCSFT